ncbi:MAG: hypothetical protein ACKPGB_16170, partial [Dolichospermum sp.]
MYPLISVSSSTPFSFAKLNELVNKQIDAIKQNLFDIVSFAKENGVELETDINGYISEIQSARQQHQNIYDQLLKAQNLELNP